MALVAPFPGHTDLTTFADLRRDLEGLVVRDVSGRLRAGVFPDHLNPLVTGRSDMRVNIGDFRAVQRRGGAVLLANVGADTKVVIAAAPATNRRIDLVYATMRSASLGDAASTPVFGVVQGVASATPVAPSLPANLVDALPMATVEVPAGATTTLSGGVVITQLYQYTALAGGTVVVRNSVELAAWSPADGSRAFNLADNSEYARLNGAWSGHTASAIRNTSTLTLTGNSWVNIGAGLSPGTSAPGVSWSAGRFTVDDAGQYLLTVQLWATSSGNCLFAAASTSTPTSFPTNTLGVLSGAMAAQEAGINGDLEVTLPAGGSVYLFVLSSSSSNGSLRVPTAISGQRVTLRKILTV